MPITIEQAKRELSIIISERPRYTYQVPVDAPRIVNADCFYVHPTVYGLRPGCLIGTWLHRFHQVSLDELSGYEGKGACDVVPAVLLGADDDSILVYFLARVQSQQDEGAPWGKIDFDDCEAYARHQYHDEIDRDDDRDDDYDTY